MTRKRNRYGYEPVGSLWKSPQPSKHGDRYLTGKLDLLGGGSIRVTLFPNKLTGEENSQSGNEAK